MKSDLNKEKMKKFSKGGDYKEVLSFNYQKVS